jgi:hypothetical protein
MNENVRVLKQYGFWDAYVRNTKKNVEGRIRDGGILFDVHKRDENYQKWIEDRSTCTFYTMIDSSFVWDNTPEGSRFWTRVAMGRFEEAKEIWNSRN